MSKYLIASSFGGLVGACCALIAVYVTNATALVVISPDINEAVASLHMRINDFYIFAGIVITLLLAINVGVYIKAEDEIERYLNENWEKYEQRLLEKLDQSLKINRDLAKRKIKKY